MPRSLEDASPWTLAAAASSINVTIKQDVWLRMAIAAPRWRCTCYLPNCRLVEDTRVAAMRQCRSLKDTNS